MSVDGGKGLPETPLQLEVAQISVLLSRGKLEEQSKYLLLACLEQSVFLNTVFGTISRADGGRAKKSDEHYQPDQLIERSIFKKSILKHKLLCVQFQVD